MGPYLTCGDLGLLCMSFQGPWPLMLERLQSKLMGHRLARCIDVRMKAEIIWKYSRTSWNSCPTCFAGWNVYNADNGWCYCKHDHGRIGQRVSERSCYRLLRNCQFKCCLDTRILSHRIKQFAIRWEFKDKNDEFALYYMHNCPLNKYWPHAFASEPSSPVVDTELVSEEDEATWW